MPEGPGRHYLCPYRETGIPPGPLSTEQTLPPIDPTQALRSAAEPAAGLRPVDASANRLIDPPAANQFFTAESPPLQVSEMRDQAAVDQLAEEWSALLRHVEHEVFVRPEFVGAWLRSFGTQNPVRLLVAREPDGALAAVLPLLETRCPEFGVRALHSAANVHSCRFDLVARHPFAAAAAFLEYLSADRSWQVLRLIDVPEGAAAWNLLLAAESAGFPVGTWASHRSRYLELPSSTEALRERLSKNLLSGLRRRRRRLMESGRVSLELFTGGPELDARLEELFAVEASGWKGREGTAILQDDQTRRFYREISHAAARGGYLSLYFLRLDGRAIAADLALTYRGRFLSLKFGYDERFARFSPGQQLTLDELDNGISHGLKQFDLLGDDAPWKEDWADRVRPHHWLYLFPRTRTGRALHSAKFKLGPRLKRLLGR